MSADPHFMQLAIDAALAGVRAGEGGPFGATIVLGQRVVATACNRVTSKNDPTAHAEVEAIRAACAALGRFELSGCTIYASCEPCPMCLGAILWSRVDRLYFAASRDDAAGAGFDDAAFYAQLARPPGQRQPPMEHAPIESARAPFEIWSQLATRISY